MIKLKLQFNGESINQVMHTSIRDMCNKLAKTDITDTLDKLEMVRL